MVYFTREWKWKKNSSYPQKCCCRFANYHLSFFLLFFLHRKYRHTTDIAPYFGAGSSVSCCASLGSAGPANTFSLYLLVWQTNKKLKWLFIHFDLLQHLRGCAALLRAYFAKIQRGPPQTISCNATFHYLVFLMLCILALRYMKNSY